MQHVFIIQTFQSAGHRKECHSSIIIPDEVKVFSKIKVHERVHNTTQHNTTQHNTTYINILLHNAIIYPRKLEP